MARPKDEHGRALAQAWRRLPEARALEMAGVTALAADGRLAHLDLKRKLAIARKAIDHVVDGDLPPPCPVQGRQDGAAELRAGRGLGRLCAGRDRSAEGLRP